MPMGVTVVNRIVSRNEGGAKSVDAGLSEPLEEDLDALVAYMASLKKK